MLHLPRSYKRSQLLHHTQTCRRKQHQFFRRNLRRIANEIQKTEKILRRNERESYNYMGVRICKEKQTRKARFSTIK